MGQAWDNFKFRVVQDVVGLYHLHIFVSVVSYPVRMCSMLRHTAVARHTVLNMCLTLWFCAQQIPALEPVGVPFQRRENCLA